MDLIEDLLAQELLEHLLAEEALEDLLTEDLLAQGCEVAAVPPDHGGSRKGVIW